MTAKSKSAKYYANNPAARKKKAATDKKINARPEQVKKRVEANGARRKAKAAGKNIKNKDWDHVTRTFVKSATNRGRTSGSKGDKNARGKK